MTAFQDLEDRLRAGKVIILDGGTGTELERRGATMDADAWCGPATVENLELLESIHLDYINAGADVITANTYASSRLMLASSSHGDRFAEINQAAIAAAHRARDRSGRPEVVVAGSLSHMCPMVTGSARADLENLPSRQEMADAFDELADLLKKEGCDLILLEMMYDPDRIQLALEAASKTELPMWLGFSARRGKDGRILSFEPSKEIPFSEVVQIADDFNVAAAGVMHTPSDVTGEALEVLRQNFAGPLMAYPDSGYFKMPHWHFEDVISPEDFATFAKGWLDQGVQIIGGCCGLSPEHIREIAPIKFC